ncbi:MAG: HopJ type III effector protein [Chromatiales bacterium]|jgi:hypothetical protein
MTLDDFIARLGTNHNLVFEETLAIITSYYDFTPTGFTNGIGDDSLCNGPDEKQLLACFGEHYRKVLASPGGTDHANIRTFIRHGWGGIRFEGEPLRIRPR